MIIKAINCIGEDPQSAPAGVSLTRSRHVDSLPHVRRDGLDPRGERSMNRGIDRSVPDFGACRVLAKEVVAFPVPRRPNGSWNKSATAVRTHVFQDVIDARRAEGALVGADASVERVGSQQLIAVLTSWSQFKHGGILILVMVDEQANWRPAQGSAPHPGRPR
jgi:hypothetical protein